MSAANEERLAMIQHHGSRRAALSAAQTYHDAARTDAHRAYWATICEDLEVGVDDEANLNAAEVA